MKGSGADGGVGKRADPPVAQDQNPSRLSRERAQNTRNLGLNDQSEGSGQPSPRHSEIQPRLALDESAVRGSASGLGLGMQAGCTQFSSGSNRLRGNPDSYKERYDQLWREGTRHYLANNATGNFDHPPRQTWATNDSGGSSSSNYGSDSLETQIRHYSDGSGGTRDGDAQGTYAIPDVLTSGLRRRGQSQGGSAGDPFREGQQITRQTERSPVIQGQPPENPTSNWPGEEEIDVKRQAHWHNAFARLNGIEPRNSQGPSTSADVKKPKRFSPFAFLRREPSKVSRNLEDLAVRRNFLLKLAKALLYFGAPPHRIESQLVAADAILDTRAEIVYLPNIVILTMQGEEPEEAARTYFVRSKGRLALTSLHRVHLIYRDVLHDKMGAQEGIDGLKKILRAPPIYPLKFRCFLGFICSSIICVLAFGGSAVDMFISGICASILQYLGLNAANKSSMYANVYEISVSIFVAFVARGLSSIPGHVFCYSAISSAGVVSILPGFTVLISSLELMSKNIFCGSVRIVYAIIYTLFLGFGLTIGSDFYLALDRHARQQYYHNSNSQNLTYSHGQFVFSNSTSPLNMVSGVIGTFVHEHASNSTTSLKIIKGCLRDDSWSWWRQPFPWYAIFILVPLYSTCSSLSNLQSWRSIQLPVMVTFSCAAYAANKATSILLPGRTDLVSAAGAFVIGLLGNIYSRVVRGTAFTSMVTGVLFLVPSGIAQGGGLNQNYRSSSEQYSVGFSLALRMISLASGVTVGLFVSQVLVYLFGSRKNGAHFAF